MSPYNRREFIQNVLGGIVAGSAVLPLIPKSGFTKGNTEKPNIILIQTDDQGYEDIDILNSVEYLETPNLDRLADQSVQFKDFYCEPLCAPTRASTLTGRHHLKCGVWGVHAGSDFLNLDEATFGDVFKENGYTTAHFGKWHSGKTDGYYSWDRGFDHGFNVHLYRYYDSTIYTRGSKKGISGWIEEYMADKAVDFIETNQNQPFLMYYCPITAHTGANSFDPDSGYTFHAPPDYIQKYQDMGLKGSDDWNKLARLYGSLEFLDLQLGKIFKKVDSLGLSDNTIIIFISDNGPATSGALKPGSKAWDTVRSPNGVLGAKMDLWENGIRNYCLIKRTGPNGFTPKVVENKPCSVIDIFPTLLDFANIPIPADNKELDGYSMAPLCNSGEWENDDRYIYTHHTVAYISNNALFQLNEDRTIKKPQTALVFKEAEEAIRQGDFKLVSGNMYNIKESNHIEDKIVNGDPKIELRTELERWWNEDIVMAPGSFLKPTFQIGWDKQITGTAWMHSAIEKSISISLNNHDCTGWSQVGDYVILKVNVVNSGYYKLRLNYKNGKTSLGAVVKISIGDKSIEQKVNNSSSIYFPEIELNTGEQELKCEIISMDSSGTIFKLKTIEFTYVKPSSISNNEKKVMLNDVKLFQNYPNPFNSTTTIEFAIPKKTAVKIAIYNNQGQLIESLIDEVKSAGYHSVQWNFANYASGVYYYQIVSGHYIQTKKILFMK